MFIQIEFESEKPIYIQLKEQIIRGIANGGLKEGESLPSVRQLASDIGINLHTVNKAYSLLKADEFISMDRRKGAIVNPIQKKATDEYIEKLKEELRNNIATAICKGINKEEYLKISNEIFSEYGEEKK